MVRLVHTLITLCVIVSVDCELRHSLLDAKQLSCGIFFFAVK